MSVSFFTSESRNLVVVLCVFFPEFGEKKENRHSHRSLQVCSDVSVSTSTLDSPPRVDRRCLRDTPKRVQYDRDSEPKGTFRSMRFPQMPEGTPNTTELSGPRRQRIPPSTPVLEVRPLVPAGRREEEYHRTLPLRRLHPSRSHGSKKESQTHPRSGLVPVRNSLYPAPKFCGPRYR